MIIFLSYALEDPIIKKYLDNWLNKTYTSPEICDSFISSTDKYLWDQTKERSKLLIHIVLFADESSNAARKEMLGNFTILFDEKNKEFNMDFITLVEVSSKNSETVMCTIEKVLHEKDIGIEKTQFCCLDDTNSVLGEHNISKRGKYQIMHPMQYT